MNHPLMNFFTSPAILPLLAGAALKSTVLLALAALLMLALRKSSAAVRHLTWSVALLGAILLPVLSSLLPAWRTSALPDWMPAEATPVASASAIDNASPEKMVVAPSAKVMDEAAPVVQPATKQTAITQPAATQMVVPPNAVQTPTPIWNFKFFDFLRRYIGFIWLAGVGLALLPLLAGSWQVRRLTRRCEVLSGADWNSLLEETAASLNLRRPVRLLASPGVALPMTWGAWRPVILLPEATQTWPVARRRMVLLHELAHVQRWDWFTYTLAYVACAFHWYNPLAWHAARRMRLEREQACDDLVLSRNTRPSDYAGELLELAAGFKGSRLIDWATVPMARRSALEGRLLAILDKSHNRAGLTRVAVLGAVALATAVIIPVAMLRAASTATDAINQPAPVATQNVSANPFASTVNPAPSGAAENPFAASPASTNSDPGNSPAQPLATSASVTGTSENPFAPVSVKLTSLDLKPWGPSRGALTYAWGNGQRHSPTLKIGGQEFADGITMVAGGALYLNLAGGSEKFTATIGMDGASPVSAIFRVIGDDKVLYESKPKQGGDAPEKISVDTHGVKTLALDVRVQGDIHYGDMRDADWADGTFEVSGAPPQPVASLAETTLPAGTPDRLGLVEAFIVQGDVQLIDQHGNATPLSRNQKFTEGSTVKAGPNSQALLVFSNGAIMKVRANTMVKVTHFRQAPFDEAAEGTFLRLARDPSRSNTVLDVANPFQDISADDFQGEMKKLNKEAGSTFIVNGPHGPIDLSFHSTPDVSAPQDLLKLKSIVIPAINIDVPTPLDEVAQVLAQLSKKFDPAGQGVYIVIYPPIDGRAMPKSTLPNLTNLSLDQLLEIVCAKTTPVAYSYTVKNNVVSLREATGAAAPVTATPQNLQKLKSIVIPAINIDVPTPLDEVGTVLAQLSKQFDPAGRGVNVVVYPPADGSALPKITLPNLTNLSLDQLLEIACARAAPVAYGYTMKDNVVSLREIRDPRAMGQIPADSTASAGNSPPAPVASSPIQNRTRFRQ